MYVVCKEHVEKALERFVDEWEDAPDLVSLEETKFSAWEAPSHCAFCERRPEFLVV